MEAPTGICHGCQTIIDKIASTTDRNWNPFKPSFLLGGSETTTCSLCSLLEGLANVCGHLASDEYLREHDAYVWSHHDIYCHFPLALTVLNFRQLSSKCAKITVLLLRD
jgi:hypothetical protein